MARDIFEADTTEFTVPDNGKYQRGECGCLTVAFKRGLLG